MLLRGYSTLQKNESLLFVTLGRIYVNSLADLEPVTEITEKEGKIYISKKYQTQLLELIEKDIEKGLQTGKQLVEKIPKKQKLFIQALKNKDALTALRLFRDLNSLYILFDEYYLDMILEQKENKQTEAEIAKQIPTPGPSILQSPFLRELLEIPKKPEINPQISKDSETKILQLGQTLSNDIFYIRQAYFKTFPLEKDLTIQKLLKQLNGLELTGTAVLENIHLCGNAFLIPSKLTHPTLTANEIKGKILISEETTVDLTPYLNQAQALVTERGGLLSHTAIVAREQNKPAIISIKNVSSQIITGEELELKNNTLKVIGQNITML